MRNHHYLFSVFMAGGNGTIFENLKESLGTRGDFDSTWLPVSVNYSARGLIPPILRSTRDMSRRLQELEEYGIHFDAAYFFQHTIIMPLVNFRRRVPYVLALDGTPHWYNREGLYYAHDAFDPKNPAARLKQKVVRSVYRRAFHLLPLSNSVRESLIVDYGIPADRITVMPPSLNLRSWSFPQRTPEAKQRKPRVLFVGGDFERKGGDLLMSLAEDLRFADVEFHFVTSEDTFAHNGNVHMHTGIGPNTGELQDLYRSSDVFVLPTRADSHSIVSLEAMAMGLPVISTRVGGIGDIIVEGETGFYVPTDDREALAIRLRTLLDDPEMRYRMGVAGRKRVEDRFNITPNAEFVVNLLREAALARAHTG